MTLLESAAEQMGIKLDARQVESFNLYKRMILEWNEKINLTAITDENEIIIKHFIDSITLLHEIDPTMKIKAADIGTGAGFPGIPVKIMCPCMELVLMDSLNKRVKFLEEVIKALDLKEVKGLHIRAEDAGRDNHRETYDICMSRAVAALPVLVEYCIPLVKIGGKFISMKGPEVKDEILSAKKAILELGGEIGEIKSIRLPYSDITHSLIIIHKKNQTPLKYPRKSVKITKSPIE